MRRAVLPALVLLGVGACGAYGDEPPAAPPSPQPADGGSEAASGTCSVLFVSPAGDDAADGCAASAPLRTIGKAIDVARTRKLVAASIHACRGVYRESPRLDYAVSIAGSFDCATWQRDVVEPPTWLESTTLTAPDGASATLTVTGAVARDTRIETLQVEGPRSGLSGIAVLIEGASPTLSRVRVIGGNTASNGTDPGSVGLSARAGAAPAIDETWVIGGIGTATGKAVASQGIRIRDAGEVVVTASKISGGGGTATADSTFTSIGLFIKAGAPVVVRDCDIDGGNGTSDDADGAIGALVQSDASATFVHNVISGGATKAVTVKPPRAPLDLGLVVNGTATVDRNRLYGGIAPADAPSEARALAIGPTAHDVVVTNNAIHGGTARFGGSAIASATGIDIEGAKNVTVRWNTIFSGQVGTSGGGAQAIQAAGTNIAIEDNLLFAAPGGAFGLTVADCDLTALASVQRNVFFSTPWALRVVTKSGSGACDTVTDYVTVGELESQLGARFAAGTFANNFELRASCTGPAATCVSTPACAAAGKACIEAVLASWDEPSFGVNDLRENGFALDATTPCAIAKPTAPASGPAGVTVDLGGAMRTLPFSSGANESDGPCAP